MDASFRECLNIFVSSSFLPSRSSLQEPKDSPHVAASAGFVHATETMLLGGASNVTYEGAVHIFVILFECRSFYSVIPLMGEREGENNEEYWLSMLSCNL